MANEQELLEGYLQHVGLKQFAQVFQNNGVTSLKLLKMLGTPVGKDVREKIKKEISQGDGSTPVKRPKSPLGANQVDIISADDVQAWMEAQDKSTPKIVSKDPEAQAKAEKLTAAIKEVQELREKIEKTAGEDRKAIADSVNKDLNAAVARFREERLGEFPSVKLDIDNLSLMLKDTEAALQRTSKMTLEAVSKVELSAEDLIYANQMLRGRYVDANGAIEAPGGVLLALPKRCSNAELFGPGQEMCDIAFSYRSEAAMMKGQRALEIHGSSLATATEAHGAAFMGTGVGAMSCAVRYAQAYEERTDTFEGNSGTCVTEIQTRYHWSPLRQIVFSTNQFELSSLAMAELRRILNIPEDMEASRRAAVKEFMRAFGSHAFGRITLGGWYKYTAKSTARTKENRSTLEKVVASGMNWAVAMSASYVGLGGAGKVATSVTGTKAETSVNGRELHYKEGEYEVSITTTVLGGVDGLPREEWLGSLQYAPQWRVIQREAPCPVWKIIERTSDAKLGVTDVGPITEDKDKDKDSCVKTSVLAKLFEEVWVQDIFKPSFYSGTANPIAAKAKTVHELEHAVAEWLRGPRLIWSEERVDDSLGALPQKAKDVEAPALVVFDNQLHCYGVRDHSLFGAIFTGSRWIAKNNIVFGGGQVNTLLKMSVVENPSNHELYFAAQAGSFSDGELHMLMLDDKVDHANKPAATLYNEPQALAAFCGGLYVFTSIKGLHCQRLGPPTQEAPVTIVSDITKLNSIAAVAFKEKLYAIYQPDGDVKLYLTTWTGEGSWTPAMTMPTEAVAGNVALTVFGDQLYCVYGTPYIGAPLFVISTVDGVNWSRPTPIGGEHGYTDSHLASFGSHPALVTFSDQAGPKLYCFYYRDSDKRLCYRVAEMLVV